MKKLLSIFLILAATFTNLMAEIVDCGCASSESITYDVQIEYQGDGDCCHPIGFGSWAHLDSLTHELIESGTLNSGDAAGACQDVVGSLGC